MIAIQEEALPHWPSRFLQLVTLVHFSIYSGRISAKARNKAPPESCCDFLLSPSADLGSALVLELA
jgi:hypothetical protein